jgi:hypothetical protein
MGCDIIGDIHGYAERLETLLPEDGGIALRLLRLKRDAGPQRSPSSDLGVNGSYDTGASSGVSTGTAGGVVRLP